MPTIVPLTSEGAWESSLQGVLEWEPPMVPTLVLAPHPDDETLGAGGLISRLKGCGIPVTVIAITDGEGAYEGTANLASIRIAEQNEALYRLGVAKTEIHRLGLPDRKLAAHVDELGDLLLPYVSNDMHIIAPWQKDFHPDHEAAGHAAARVAIDKGVEISFYLFWTWHRGTPMLLSDFSLAKLPLTEAERAAKLYALESHVSQFEHPGGQPILSAELLAPARRDFEVYIR